MAKVQTFLCDCGRTIGRPENKSPTGPPVFAVVPWHAREGDAVIRGIRCGTCGQWWNFRKPARSFPDFVDVEKSCGPDACTTIEHLNGRCE